MTHEAYMRQCLVLAEDALAKGNIPVGALIVQHNKIIATASEELPNSLDVTAHAEILAIKRACEALGTTDLSDCILYTTAEPCWMCSYGIRETGIPHVVYGTRTLDVGGLSTAYPLLIANLAVWGKPPQITGGILAEECETVRHQS